MSKAGNLKLNQLEGNELYKAGLEIVKEAYKFMEELSENESSIKLNIRFSIGDLSGGIAEALSAIYPDSFESGLARARRGLFGIRNAYKLSKELELISIDPSFMVKLNKVSKVLDRDILNTRATIIKQNKEEVRRES